MSDARVLKAAQRAAVRTLKELSSSSPVVPALLRRCFRLLPYLEADNQCLAARCRRCLLDTLRDVLSRDPCPSLLPAIEVFAESLVFCGRLRSFFVKLDWAAPEESRVFTVDQPFRSEFHTVLELVCNHFICALENEGGCRAFLRALSWSGDELQGAPEISLKGAFSLIRTTHCFSLPGVVRAHLLLLASRCINGPDLDCHLPAFQNCMALYVGYLPALGVFNRSSGVKNPESSLAGKRSLTFCIKEVTHQKLENKVNGLLSFCKAHITDDLPISDSDIYDISDRFIKENQHVVHEKFRQKATTAVKRILSKILPCAKQNELRECDAEITEDIFCLAAVLRVMGSLLQQILDHFSHKTVADGKESATHTALCGNFSNLSDTICFLSHYEANELYRCYFIDTIGKPADRERASIQMLSHFASLSVFCIRRRLGFLWRICITMMMMAVNLVILEGARMDILECLIDASEQSSYKGDSQIQHRSRRRSSKVIAVQWVALQNRNVEKTDGRAFLQSHPLYKPSWDDLDDFFECEKGKDYSISLNRLKTFKDFKVKKYISKKRTREDMEGPCGEILY